MSHQDLSPQGWAPKIQKKGRTLVPPVSYGFRERRVSFSGLGEEGGGLQQTTQPDKEQTPRPLQHQPTLERGGSLLSARRYLSCAKMISREESATSTSASIVIAALRRNL